MTDRFGEYFKLGIHSFRRYDFWSCDQTHEEKKRCKSSRYIKNRVGMRARVKVSDNVYEEIEIETNAVGKEFLRHGIHRFDARQIWQCSMRTHAGIPRCYKNCRVLNRTRNTCDAILNDDDEGTITSNSNGKHIEALLLLINLLFSFYCCFQNRIHSN